jgi:hypothetical protein
MVNKDHKTCTCKRPVPFPLWYHQRGKGKKPTCPLCVAKEALKGLNGPR